MWLPSPPGTVAGKAEKGRKERKEKGARPLDNQSRILAPQDSRLHWKGPIGILGAEVPSIMPSGAKKRKAAKRKKEQEEQLRTGVLSPTTGLPHNLPGDQCAQSVRNPSPTFPLFSDHPSSSSYVHAMPS